MAKEIISIVMATYNGGKYIKDQLESIRKQTCQPDEIIIADDCSSDDTIKIINSFKNSTSIKIVNYVNKNNLGYIKNFKNAISKAKGDYIFLCDQDDIWEKNKIEETLKIMKQNKAEIACSGFTLIDGKGNFIKNTKCFKMDPIMGYEQWTYSVKKISVSRLIWGNFSPGCTYCFSNKVQGIFNSLTNVELSHDFQLLLIGANYNAAIYIDKPLSRYRLHDSNTVGMNNKEAKRKRHIKPRLTRFLNELNEFENIEHLLKYNLILYLRLPKIRSEIIHKLHLQNRLSLE